MTASALSQQQQAPAHQRHRSANAHHYGAARQTSVDVNSDGCCLLKAFISNLLTFATRSRRKGADLNATRDARTGANNGGFNASNGAANNATGTTLLPSSGLAASVSAASNATKKTGVVSFSQVGSARSARKAAPSVDTCVADSFDDLMIEKLCALPRGMNRNEWLATHTLALFDHVNGLCGTMSEICTPVSCSVMSYPGNMKAYWVDERGKRHNYSAMCYIDSVMSFCEASRKNQALFPTKFGVDFSPDFDAHCCRMVRLLWHSCGHLYSKHWEQLGALNLRPQFGLVLAHMAKVSKAYGLLDSKDLASLNNTLQLVRPPTTVSTTVYQQQSRPQKRQGTDELEGDRGEDEDNRTQQKKGYCSDQQSILSSMKSGSWGGHSTQNSVATVVAATVAPTPRCYAQTC